MQTFNTSRNQSRMTAPALLSFSPDHRLRVLMAGHRRIMLTGAPGTGKTTLAADAARHLATEGIGCHYLGADPGQPGAGLPGALTLAIWEDGHWRVLALEALCTLDAGRFRLPLLMAAGRLASRIPHGHLLIDAPGVVRGNPGAELLPALAEASGAEAVVILAPQGADPPLLAEHRATGRTLLTLRSSPKARRPGPTVRARRRTGPWDDHLAQGEERVMDLEGIPVVGAPPPRHAAPAWTGRQIGLLDGHGQTLGMGEIVALNGQALRIRAPATGEAVAALVVRDARRGDDGLLGTAPPHRDIDQPLPAPVPAGRTRAADHCPTVSTGLLTASLVNGVFGDPLLHLRLRHRQRSLLFDLGETGRLSARIAHQVSDVFVSHAHFDHFGGFLRLLRSRIGDLPPCRIHGPPGIAARVAGLVDGILWDRAGQRAPRFRVAEFHGAEIRHFRITAGEGAPRPAGSESAADGILLREPGWRIRAIMLDHGTPVLAFAFEPEQQLRVRKERLADLGWPPGPWLGELKQRILAGQEDARISLPDGSSADAATLAELLLLAAPGQRLVYATDLGDTPENRARLADLARGAHTLFCEAPFLRREAEQAARTGHLTTRACGEIAAAAGVGQLIPFHFSRRHAGEAGSIYAEIRAAFPRTVVPPLFSGTPPRGTPGVRP
ncbi:MAG: hypothetical protein JJT90_15385 [Ectothiorhodospiraceae bacterium]|nr:hypothetical protein [Ectothiorhodospiraceae bacterium]